MIDSAGFERLRQALAAASDRGVLLYDIMTERHEITTLLQNAFATLARAREGGMDQPRAL